MLSIRQAGTYCGSFAAVLLCGVSTHAFAQAAAPIAPAQPAQVGEIIVTGSRISRSDFVAESPITTVSLSTIKSAGTPQLEETINFMPQFSDASTGQSRQVNGAAPGAGRTTTNLRGLGTSRTLVLLDGRRLQPSDAYNVVDINQVPTVLLSGVEVITGGASAVYGSDAVAGVVNYKTKTNFSGLELDGDLGGSELGDAKYLNISALAGKNFKDHRGNAILALSYFDRGEARLGKRDWFAPSNVTSRGPDGQITNAGITQAALNNLFITKYGLPRAPLVSDTLSVNPDGTVYSQGGGSNAVNCKTHPGLGANAAYNYNPYLTPNECDASTNNSALLPIKRINVFGKVNYAINDSIEAFGQINALETKTWQTQSGANLSNTALKGSPLNSTIPPDVAALLAARPNPSTTFQYSVRTNKVGEQYFEQKYQSWQVFGGLRGKLGVSDWKWEAYVGTGGTRDRQYQTNLINTANLARLLIAPDAGNSICSGGWNLFNTQAPLSDACRQYVARNTTSHDTFKQDLAEAQVEGRLFKGWAGDVRGVVGLEYRRNSYVTTPDVQLQTLQLSSGGLSTSTPILPGSGSQSVKDVFVEGLVPVLANVPLVQELSADLAYRYSDYNTSGGASTWKADLLWKVNHSLLFRGGVQRAIRAPSVGELFAGQFSTMAQLGTVSTGGGDPCAANHPDRSGPDAAKVQALCIAQGVPEAKYPTFVPTGSSFQQVSAGNPNLRPEKADSYTYGMVLQPTFLPPVLSRASLSVDYYNVSINNAIGSISGPQELLSCFNLNGQNPTYSPSNVTCQTIRRQSDGQLDSVLALPLNLFKYQTAGIDVEFDWRVRAADLNLDERYGSLAFNVSVTRVTKYLIQKDISQPPLNFNNTISGNNQASISSSPADSESWSHPNLKAFSTITWSKAALDLSVRLRYIGPMRDISTVTTPTSTVPGVRSVTYVDLDGVYRLNDRLELRAGVVNLTNRQPEETNGQAGLTDPNLYDRVGRRYFVSATWRMP